MEQTIRKKLVTEIFYAALKAVDPYNAVKLYTHKIRSVYREGNFKRFIAISFGKAAGNMARAVEDEIEDLIDAGAIITKDGHNISQGLGVKEQRSKIKIYEAGHPVPNENGLRGTEEIIRLLKDADKTTLVVCLISGGGSALLVSPYEGISLTEKQEITDLLLKVGADINELNTVRKHISKVKGGRLAEIAYPAMVISLILSDVIGDRLDVIASGPTAPDKTTFRDALDVLEKYSLTDGTPKNIMDVLKRGAKGLIRETPKEGHKIFQNVKNIVIGSNKIALNAAKQKAEELGLYSEIISSKLTGEARDAGRWLAKKVEEFKSLRVQGCKMPVCIISGGETTVTVKGNGIGGRNMELALSFAVEIEGIDDITLLSAGTDGTDGPTDAGGAIVDGDTVRKAKSLGINPLEYLDNNDSYNFFKKIDGLFITGPTGTNVMDIQIIVIDKPQDLLKINLLQ